MRYFHNPISRHSTTPVSRRPWGRRALLAAAVALSAGSLALGAQQTVVWTGAASGTWETAGNWTPNVVPDNSSDTYVVQITNGGSSATVTMNASHTIDNLILDAGSILDIANNQTLTFATNGTIVDNGTINLNFTEGGNQTQITFAGNLLSGSGVLNLDNGANTAQLTGTFTQDTNHTIAGLGAIIGTFTNNGTVNANVNGGIMSLQTSAMTNNKTFEATNGGILNINGITVTQGASGQILASGTNGANLSTVELSGNTTISGGTLTTASGGVIINSGGTNTLSGVTNSGTFEIANNTETDITGNLVDNGSIIVNYNQGGNVTTLSFNGGTLSGTGTITLNNGGNNAQISGSLTQSSGHSIQGQGQINAVLTNNGTVNANVSAGTLSLLAATLTNTATLEATNGGTLHFGSAIAVTNTGGNVTAGGGNVLFDGSATLSGGTLTSTGTNFIETSNAGFTTFTLASGSVIQVDNNTNTDFTGTITNNGNIIVNPNQEGNSTTVTFHGAASLAGSGTITLNNAANTAQINTAASSTLTQAASHTIQGQGQINAVLTNNGTVNANVSGGTLTLQTSAMTNNNLFEATAPAAQSNVGTLNISGITVTQGINGVILADGVDSNTGANHSTVNLTGGTTISGGTLNTTNGGLIINSSGTNTLNSLTNSGTFEISNNTETDVTGNLVDNGSFLVNYQQAGNTTILSFNGGTLSGSGTITLNNANNTAELNGSLTQSSGHTIAGQGEINAVLTNNGLVNANVSGQTLSLLAATLTNTSTLEATNGGTLHFGSGIAVTNTGGTVTANGGNVLVDGSSSITGGTLTSTGTNFIETNGASFTTFTLSTGSVIQVDNNSNTDFTGTITNNGNILVNANHGGNVTSITFHGAASLAGAGTITLNNGGNTAQLNTADSSTVTQGVNHTIQGQGVINAALTNNGTVNANVSGGTLTLQTSAMTNNSLMEATGSGTLAISGITVTQGASGNIKADNATVNLTGSSTISGGTLTTANGGIIFNSGGTNTLDSLTNNADFRIINSTQTNVTGDLVDNGTITINSNQGGNQTELDVVTGTVSGTGAIILNNSGNSARLDGVLTQASTHSITGQGTINAALTNNGVVNANVSGGTLTLQTNNMTNNNLFEATAPAAASNVGTLNISGITVTQGTNGDILADGVDSNTGANHSTVNLTGGTTISGGTLTTTNGGIFFNSGGTNTLDSLTNNADFRIINSTQTNVTGDLVNNGTITINSNQGGNETELDVVSGTVSGTGTIILNNSGNQAVLAGILTQTSTHTIQGFGALTAALTNQGLVNANVSGQILSMPTASSNTGTYEASNGATLDITGDVAQDDAATAGVLTAGTYEVLANSTLAITSPAQHLTQIGASAVVILSGTNSIFTSGGEQIDLTLTTNNGELHVLNRTFAALAFTNSGLLQLGGGGGLPTGGGVFNAPTLLNTGTIEATGTGNVLSITAGITDPPLSSTITIDSASSLDISGGGPANATVFLNQNGTLALGANSITVSGDYTNPNFDTTPGNPNTFNKHANVTGTGQILAAPGTAGLALLNVSGTGVTNGASATPTISGINAHLGIGSTYNFQLNNTGAAGTNPTIRGAIQNSGVTSSQLTVAAADYALAPGADTPFSVTFTPTAIGPIAAGQTIHIANNFDNVTEQNVTITGAGYALASTNFNTTTVTLPSIRVGSSFASQSLSISNTLSASIYNETLGAQFANALGVTTAGSPITVLAGAPANTSMTVSLPSADNATPGLKSGTVDVQFNSQAVNGSGLGTTSLSALNQTVTVSGAVYRVASVNTLSTPINLGIIHPNDSFGTQALSITNTAANDGFSEGLDAAVTGTTPGASSSGAIANLAAGSSSSSGNQITVGLGSADTSASGAKTGTVTVGFSTDGATTSLLAAAPLTGPTASQVVTVNGQVNNYAAPAFHKSAGSGTLSNDDTQATSYTLDFGTLTANATGSASISLANLLVAASATFQDSLAGTFSIASGAGNFQLTGFGDISDSSAIAPNTSQAGDSVSFTNLGPGSYSESLLFTPVSTTNGLSADASIPTDPSGITFNITLQVNPSGVPEPASLALLGLGAAALLTRRRR